MGINKVMLLGMVKKVESRFTQNGSRNDTISLEIDNGEKYPDYIRVSFWPRGDIEINPGMIVMVDGRIKTRSYEGKDGKKQYITEVQSSYVVDQSHLINMVIPDTPAQSRAPKTDNIGNHKPPPQGRFDYGPPPLTDDDIPF